MHGRFVPIPISAWTNFHILYFCRSFSAINHAYIFRSISSDLALRYLRQICPTKATWNHAIAVCFWQTQSCLSIISWSFFPWSQVPWTFPFVSYTSLFRVLYPFCHCTSVSLPNSFTKCLAQTLMVYSFCLSRCSLSPGHFYMFSSTSLPFISIQCHIWDRNIFLHCYCSRVAYYLHF